MKNRRKTVIIGIVVAAIAIPVGIYTISPLFVNTTINEPLPTANTPASSSSSAAKQAFEKFMAMGEEERLQSGQQMPADQREMVLRGAAQTNGSTVNEEMTQPMIPSNQTASVKLIGTFVGVNDGIHNAAGMVRVIALGEANNTTATNNNIILRLENFKSTNGPDLYVYLSTDSHASNFVSLGRLKGNIGNQNYEIPIGTDLSKYHTVLIWCRAFSVLFGHADLRSA